MKIKWSWVDSTVKRDKAARDIMKAPVIGVDTEYDSFRYFREKLCLLQINSGLCSYIFDPLASIDISFLGDVFASTKTVKVIHAGDNDIRILKRDYDFSFNQIFDTHRAAALLGCRQLSLSALIRQFLSIDFDKQKKLQRSRWENRPLTEEQLHYAAQDTVFLIDLYKKLQGELENAGLLEAAAEGFEGIASVSWHEKIMNRQGYRHIQGFNSLTAEARERLKRLYKWRFNKGKNINRALFMIISDQELLQISRTGEPNLVSLITNAGLSQDKVHRYGNELLDILKD